MKPLLELKTGLAGTTDTTDASALLVLTDSTAGIAADVLADDTAGAIAVGPRMESRFDPRAFL